MYYVSVFLGFSIVFAAIIGLVRFRKTLPAYLPFFLFVWLNLLNHSLSTILIETHSSNVVNGNIYVLLECGLLLWLLAKWGLFYRKERFAIILFLLLAFIWIVDNLIWHSLLRINSLFRVLYSFTLVLLGVHQVNRIITEARGNLLRHSQFLISIVLIIYFTYKGTVEVFYLLEWKASDRFYRNLFLVFIFVNLFANLVYAFAALWIPTRQKFTARF